MIPPRRFVSPQVKTGVTAVNRPYALRMPTKNMFVCDLHTRNAHYSLIRILQRLDKDHIWKKSAAQKLKYGIGILLQLLFVFLVASVIVYGTRNGWSFTNVFPPKMTSVSSSKTATFPLPTPSLLAGIIPTPTMTVDVTFTPTPEISQTPSASPTITLTASKTPYPIVTWTFTPTKTMTATSLVVFTATHLRLPLRPLILLPQPALIPLHRRTLQPVRRLILRLLYQPQLKHLCHRNLQIRKYRQRIHQA